MAQPTQPQIDYLLIMLTNNLELMFDYYDIQAEEAKKLELTQYILSAIKYIEREGITLKLDVTNNLDYEAISDCNLVTMYACYLYDERKNGVATFPRALRYNLNNRVLQEKVKKP